MRAAAAHITHGGMSKLIRDPAGTLAEWEARAAQDPDAAITLVDAVAITRRLAVRLARDVDDGTSTVESLRDGIVQALLAALSRLETVVSAQARLQADQLAAGRPVEAAQGDPEMARRAAEWLEGIAARLGTTDTRRIVEVLLRRADATSGGSAAVDAVAVVSGAHRRVETDGP